MITLILCVLGLVAVQIFLPALLRVFAAPMSTREKLQYSLGPRDQALAEPPLAARAQRAMINLSESLPIFLTLALLHVIQHTDSTLAVQSASLFLIARIAYVPAYLSGIPGVRSAAWAAGAAAMIAMAYALIA